MSNLRDQIASLDDTQHEIVIVPEWANARIQVRSISLATRNRIAGESRDKKGRTDTTRYYPRLIVESCFDPESGEQVFTRADIPMLESKNTAAVDRVAKVALRLAGVRLGDDEDDEDAARTAMQEEVDAAGKDSSWEEATSAPSSPSPNDSAALSEN